MGGEKMQRFNNESVRQGSPPRGRGKDDTEFAYCVNDGITPAWAGKSHWHGVDCRDSKDHPRVGGEKFMNKLLFGGNAGSPPRGRGKGQ